MILSATAVLTAVWLGILTSISPCPLATNVAAMSFIGKDLASPRRVLLTGVLYTLGRSLAYAVLAALLIASVFAIPDLSFWLSTYMNQFLGPVLIVTGIVLLELVRINFATSCVSEKAGSVLDDPDRGVPACSGFSLPYLFARCPRHCSSAACFRSRSRMAPACCFPRHTEREPVFVFTVLIAPGAQWVSKAFKKLVQFEKWARRVTGAVFIFVGIRYCLIYIFEVQL